MADKVEPSKVSRTAELGAIRDLAEESLERAALAYLDFRLREAVERENILAFAKLGSVSVEIRTLAAIEERQSSTAAGQAPPDEKAVLVLTKTDLVDPETAAAQAETARPFLEFSAVHEVAALDGVGLDALLGTLKGLLPPGPRYFPRDMRTDQPLEVMLAEFIREKVLIHMREEVPHAVGVAIENLTYDPKADRSDVVAVIFVERDSQKGMLVGKGGSMIKRLGSEARHDLERLLGTDVFLDLVVKVKKGWRRDAAQIRRFGYGEGL